MMDDSRPSSELAAAAKNTCGSSGRFMPWLLGTLCLLAVWLVILYHGGEQSYVRIHDTLDGNIPVFSVLMQSDVCFGGSDAVFQPLIGGLPRNCLPSETSLHLLPYRYFSAFHAYVLCEVIVRVIALLGMALLLRRHLIPSAPNVVVFGVSLYFAFLPFFPCVGLTVAGQPLLLYAILNLRNRDLGIANWLIVALFPLVSSLVLIGFALIPMLALLVVHEAVFRRKATLPLLFALVLLTCGYAVAEYRLFVQMFCDRGFVSHRVEYDRFHKLSFKDALTSSLESFYRGGLDGRAFVDSLQFPGIVLACLIAVGGWIVLRNRDAALPAEDRSRRIPREVVGVLVCCFLCAFIACCYGFFDWTFTGRVIRSLGVSLLRTVQFNRVHWLHPLCWSLAFAFAIGYFARRFRWGVALAVLFIALQMGMAVRMHVSHNYAQLWAGDRPKLRPTFAQFFSKPLFEDIRDYIGRPQEEYRVVSLGLAPGVALYGGFYTGDGYVQNFPLDYKHRFRKVIAGELEQDAYLRHWYDAWGSRCCLFSHELAGRQQDCTKDDCLRSIKDLRIDTVALRKLGVEYILSTVEVGNYKSLGLKLERVFERDDSPWQIYLYSIKEGALL
jgi:hypothetical protein